MKIKIVAFLLLVFINIASYSSSKYSLSDKAKMEWYKKSVVGYPKSHLYTSEDVRQLVHVIVPSMYEEAFLQHSVLELEFQTNVLRIYLLGLGMFESGWIKTRSNNQNANGTYDWGYLMLNEHNIANKRFMAAYSPDRGFIVKDRIELWLIVCIKYFKELYLKYGCDAFYAYNAGETKYVSDEIPDMTYIYKYRVKENIDCLLDLLYAIGRENRIALEKKILKEQKRFIYGELARLKSFRSLHALSGLQNQYKYPHGKFWKLSFVNDIVYDPKKRLIHHIDIRKFIIASKVNDNTIERALL